MAEIYYAGVYWGVRQERLEQCTQRTMSLLAGLAQIHPLFSRWDRIEQADEDDEGENTTVQPLNVTEPALQELLRSGQNYTDFGHQVMPELGFHFSITAQDQEEVSLRVTCGAYAPQPGINSCVLTLPATGPTTDQILQTPTLLAILRVMVSAWQPDWGVVTSDDYQNLIPFPASNAPRMGWLVYLSQACGPLPQLPFQVIPLNTGNIIAVTDERFTANNPAHVMAANRLGGMLDAAGLRGPLR
jgi:hypothetical protein